MALPSKAETQVGGSLLDAQSSKEVGLVSPTLSIRNLNIYFKKRLAVGDVSFDVPKNEITALIGPSGCGKTSVLRCINRLSDMIPDEHVEGEIWFDGLDIVKVHKDLSLHTFLNPNSPSVISVRQRIGMVFQTPNPFPKSIYDNVAFGPKLYGIRGKKLDEIVEWSLTQATLWDEVKDKLKQSGLELSGGQQQRLCIARTLAVAPEVVLLDESTSSLDPPNMLKIEELLQRLKSEYTIVIVTHNIQQAQRLCGGNDESMLAFFMTKENPNGGHTGHLAEYGSAKQLMASPPKLLGDYLTGRFG